MAAQRRSRQPIPLSTDENTQHRLRALESDSKDPWRGDTGWTNLTLAGTYTNGTPALAYRKIGGVVYVRGYVNQNSNASGGTIATLPAGFRPGGGTWRFAAGGLSGANMAVIDIETGGAIKWFGAFNTGAVGISTCFPAEN